jgi:hypothetical protein
VIEFLFEAKQNKTMCLAVNLSWHLLKHFLNIKQINKQSNCQFNLLNLNFYIRRLLSMLFANDAEDCLLCHGVNFLADLQFNVEEL